HVRDCRDCAELLAELRQMSQLLAAAPPADMPAQAMNRLEQSFWANRDRGVLRLAEWMTGMAAAVLVGAAILWHAPAPTPTSSTNLQAAALMPPAETRDDASASSDVVVLAEWMANDLSTQARATP